MKKTMKYVLILAPMIFLFLTSSYILNAQTDSEELVFTLEADKDEIKYGEGATLKWSVPKADRITISVSSQMAMPDMDYQSEDSITFYPKETTRFTFNAFDENGKEIGTKGITIKVVEDVKTNENVSIDSFKASYYVISEGKEVELSWETKFAKTLKLIDSSNNELDIEGKDMIVVSPEETTTYTLIAEGENRKEQAALTIDVGSEFSTKFKFGKFCASQTYVENGGQAIYLSWHVENALVVNILVGPEFSFFTDELKNSGRIKVSPSVTTTYRLEVMDYFGNLIEKDIKIVVEGTEESVPIPNVMFRPSDSKIKLGENLFFDYALINCDSCKILDDDKNVIFESTKQSGTFFHRPQKTTTYTIIADGKYGTVSKSETIEVIDETPKINKFKASKNKLIRGESFELSWETENVSEMKIIEMPDNKEIKVESDFSSGSIVLSPKKKTEYKLQIVGKNGDILESESVSVEVGKGKKEVIKSEVKSVVEKIGDAIFNSHIGNEKI